MSLVPNARKQISCPQQLPHPPRMYIPSRSGTALHPSPITQRTTPPFSVAILSKLRRAHTHEMRFSLTIHASRGVSQSASALVGGRDPLGDGCPLVGSAALCRAGSERGFGKQCEWRCEGRSEVRWEGSGKLALGGVVCTTECMWCWAGSRDA